MISNLSTTQKRAADVYLNSCKELVHGRTLMVRSAAHIWVSTTVLSRNTKHHAIQTLMDGHRLKTGSQKIWVNTTEQRDRFSETDNSTE